MKGGDLKTFPAGPLLDSIGVLLGIRLLAQIKKTPV